MKFRKRPAPHVLGFQIAPMVDILLVLLLLLHRDVELCAEGEWSWM